MKIVPSTPIPQHQSHVLVQQLRHRRSSLPAILEDTRALFREGLREKDKKESRSSDKDSSSSRHAPDTFHPSHSSSSPRRPPLKSTLSTPDVGRASQIVPSPKVVDPPLHAPTPISHEHRRRRTSLPNGLEAALKAPSHALWLPHHTEEHSHEHSSHGKDHSVVQANVHSSSHSRSSNSVSHSRPSTNSHSRARASTTHSQSQTPRHYDNAQLPPHAHEQPHLRGGSASAPPPVTFLSPPQPSGSGRPVSQITTSSHITVASHKSSHSKSSRSTSSKSSSSKSSPPEKITPPLPSPVPSTKPSIEPQTPKSTRSNLFSFPTIDDVFSKDETSHSMKSIRRLFGLSTPKHEPRKLPDDEMYVKKAKHSRESSKDLKEGSLESDRRHRNDSFTVNPPARETLHRARHSFDLGTFSLLDDMHMRWTTATARHFLPVLTPAEIQASHLTLTLNPALATIHWDIRHPPNAVWSVIPGRRTVLWTGHNEPATVPLVPSLRIISPYFPWIVSARNPAGVTCGDILSAIHSSALQLVWRGEFDKLRSEDKSRLAAGYHANRPAKGAPKTSDSPFDAGSWLVRADWLGRYTVLRGMTVSEGKDKNGSTTSDVLLNMYLAENNREADKQAVVLVRH
ncbi:hypothetical protein RSOLAG1IB_00677 [Rhizoctonia solani AG-1 IB]|uniref:DUF6699 domain-containing protein n=1 Tax=Thanatephorus cucumeris (strain AG1-IB / isolate 7/3/14) TaxID=1108050 RepID=A0A0B7F5F7_THACB|nr:hypothetical protein RSOLAG1IB_00677 [Rhizoctonia solani AG-1 IB]